MEVGARVSMRYKSRTHQGPTTRVHFEIQAADPAPQVLSGFWFDFFNHFYFTMSAITFMLGRRARPLLTACHARPPAGRTPAYFMASVKKLANLGGLGGYYSDNPFAREALAGGSWGTQKRTGVYFKTEALLL